MKIIQTAIPDVLLLQPQVFSDQRGHFMETFQAKEIRKALGSDFQFVQDNESFSRQGVLRGLHFQLQHPQGKLVRVVQGEIFDVGLDIRPKSKTLGRYVSAYLSPSNQMMLWIPPGFAHGFYVTNGPAVVLYKTTDFFYKTDSFTLRFDDPVAQIHWPIPEYTQPILSRADSSSHLSLQNIHTEVYQKCA